MDSGNSWQSGKSINNKSKRGTQIRRRIGAITEPLESRQMMSTVMAPAIVHAAYSTPLPTIAHVITNFDARLVKQVHANLDRVSNAGFDTLIANEQTHFADRITKMGGTYTPTDISTLAFEATAPVLTATAVAANHVTLTWTPISGATSYTVEVSSGKSHDWASVITTSNTTASDTNLTGKTLYRFRVTASNGSENSMTSKVVSIRPATAASAEQRQAKAIALSVERFETNLTQYLQKNAANANNPKYEAHVAQLQRAFAKRLAHTGVVYEPQAIGSMLGGNVGGANDGPVAAAVTVSNNEIDLSWPATTGAIVYLVEVSPDGGTTWNVDAYTLTNSYDDVGLNSETAYSYRVTATTSSGPTAAGATATATTLPDSPASLVLASDTPTTSGASFTLSWAPVAGAADYHISYATDPSQLSLSSAAMIDAGNSTSAAIGGLATGTTYFVSVQALDTTGQMSAPSDVASMLTTPDSPTVTGSSPTTSEVDLSWDAIATATSYTVLKDTSGTWAPVGSNITGTSFADTHLTADSQYAYSVVANNVTGAGVASDETDVMTRMNAPSGFTTVASTNSLSATLTWSKDDATSYIVQRSTDELTWGTVSGSPTIGDTTVTLTDNTNLTPGGTYYYRVFDVNSAGSGLPTAIKSALMVPATPTLTLTSVSSGEIDLNWQPVFGASSYLIERSSPDDQSFSMLTTVNQGPGFYADKTALPDTVYYYRITASNATGSLAASTEQTTSTRLGAVAGLTATASTTVNGEIDLSWTKIADATSYTVLRKTGNGAWAPDSATQTAGDTAVTLSDTGLADGTIYSYAIVANSTLGVGDQSSTVTALTLPGAPTLTASPVSATEIDLSWTAMPGATSYVLEKHDSTGTTFAPVTVSDPTATKFIDTSVVGNSAYAYEVFAVDATGSSPASAEADATALLPTPTGFTVTAVTGIGTNMILSWTALDSADNYTLRRSTPDAAHWLTISTAIAGDAITYTDTTVLPGTKYYYSLTAVSQTLGSSAATIASATTVPAVPVVTATSVSAGEIDLTWPAVQGATSYALSKNTTDGWVVVNASVTSPYKDTSLTADTAQAYKLYAVNGGGSSPGTAEIDATTRVAAPAGFAAVAASGTQIGLAWTAVTDATTYEVDRAPDPTKGPWTTLTTTLAGSATTFTDPTTLVPVTHYYYRIDATNAQGVSTYSNADATTLMASPTGLKSVVTTASVTVSWSAVPGATDYVLQRSGDNGAHWVKQTLSGKGVFTFADTAIESDKTYQYQVQATGANGSTSAFGAPLSVTTMLAPPSNLATSATAGPSVTLTWTPVADATGYIIKRALGSGAAAALPTTTLAGTDGTFVDSTVVGNSTYNYTIIAVNKLGNSVSSSAVPVLTAPTTPVGLTATSNPGGTLTLNWTAATGTGVTYTVQNFNGLLWNNVSPGPSSNTLSITGLQPDVAYTYRVIATNNSGPSLPSASVTATTAAVAPDGLTATSPKATEIDLTWSPRVNAIGYKIERSADNKTWATVVAASAKSTATAAADTTVTAGTSYYYRLSSITVAGTGTPSQAMQTISRPVAVASVGITGTTSTTMNLIWASVTGASNYQINIQPKGSSTWTPLASTSSPTFAVHGLTPDTTYSYQIISSNYAGAAAASASGVATTLLDAVHGLTVVPAGPGINQVNLAWAAETDAASYVIQRSTDNTTFTKLATQASTVGVTFSDKTVAANTNYYYEIAAVDAVGTSAFSSSVAILSVPSSPAAPTTTKVTTSEVDLTWAPVKGITNYYLEVNNGITGWHGLNSGSPTTFNATGLAPDTSYQFRVTSINSTGSSLPSAVLTVATAPAAPTTLTAKPISVSEIDLAWTGISDATTYSIRRSTDNSTWTTLAPSPALGKASVAYADKTAAAGTKYYYQLSVSNGAGKSDFGPSVSALTFPGVPSALAGTASGAGQITLTWTAVSSATSYLIERSTGTTAHWTAVGSSASTAFIDSGLTKGTAYQYRLTAINPTGKGATSAAVSVTAALPPVTDLKLTATSATDVTLAWTPIAGATKYKIERSTNNFTWTTPALVTVGATKTVDDKTVTAGNTYYYRITAVASIASGNSVVSPVKVITTLLAAPVAPTAKVISGVEIDLTWKAITGASSYILQGSATGTTWTNLTTTNAATVTYSNTGLTAKTKYFYRLIAVNIAGNSAPSAVVNATTTA